MFHLNFSVNVFLVVINFCLIITLTRKWSESHFGPPGEFLHLVSVFSFFYLPGHGQFGWVSSYLGISKFLYVFFVLEESTHHNHIIKWHIHILALHFHWLYHAVYVCLLLFDMPFLFQSLHYSLLKLLTGRVLVLFPVLVVVLRKTVPWHHHLFLPLGRGY